jgi:hypothetical protein
MVGEIESPPTGETMMSNNQATAVRTGGLAQPAALGRLESASHEVSLAGERQAIARLPRQRLASLLKRSDRLEEALEELNLLNVQRVPYPWLSELADLIADLPFDFPLQIEQWPTPTASLDLVFDLQEGILRCLRGPEAGDEPLEHAS